MLACGEPSELSSISKTILRIVEGLDLNLPIYSG